jgi:hypothetical protein
MDEAREYICPVKDCTYWFKTAPGISTINQKRGPWCWAHDEAMIDVGELNLQGRLALKTARAKAQGEDHIHLPLEEADEIWEALSALTSSVSDGT